MSTGSLGLQGALLLGGILDNSLGLVITDLSTLLESTASRGTQLPRLLGTSSDRGVFLHTLLVDIAHLSGPLGALGEGGVTTGLILTLFNIIFNIMFLLLGPALRLILGSTDLRALHITVLNQGSSAHLHCLIEGNLLIVDEAVLPEVLLTFLLLLGLVVGYIGGVASPVIGMVTLDNLIIFSLLHHLDLVNAPLSISTRSCSSNSSKAHINTIRSLTVNTGLKVLAGGKAGNWCWCLSTIGIEGKGVEKRSLSPLKISLCSQLSGSLASSNQKQNQELRSKSHSESLKEPTSESTSTAQH